MTLVAPRIVTSVSCLTRLNHEIHISWQAQYLVSFLVGRKSRMSLRTAICNLLSHAVACCDKANKVRVIRKGFNSINQQKWFSRTIL